MQYFSAGEISRFPFPNEILDAVSSYRSPISAITKKHFTENKMIQISLSVNHINPSNCNEVTWYCTNCKRMQCSQNSKNLLTFTFPSKYKDYNKKQVFFTKRKKNNVERYKYSGTGKITLFDKCPPPPDFLQLCPDFFPPLGIRLLSH